MESGDLVVDACRHGLRAGSGWLPLTRRPILFTLLRALAEHAGTALTRERLMVLVRGNAEDAFDRSVDVQISRLRHKLGDDPRYAADSPVVRDAPVL